ncbi:hypothetical protein [Peribacillus sp. NPDC097295]|uniref:hypothetical protein n=1 Tax=Peribacillus sp. NPDC097295 TaxID=3364402 RepID=UPI0037F1B243
MKKNSNVKYETIPNAKIKEYKNSLKPVSYLSKVLPSLDFEMSKEELITLLDKDPTKNKPVRIKSNYLFYSLEVNDNEILRLFNGVNDIDSMDLYVEFKNDQISLASLTVNIPVTKSIDTEKEVHDELYLYVNNLVKVLAAPDKQEKEIYNGIQKGISEWVLWENDIGNAAVQTNYVYNNDSAYAYAYSYTDITFVNYALYGH